MGAASSLETNGIAVINGRDIDLDGRVVGRDGLELTAVRDFASRGDLLTGGNLQINAGDAALILGIAAVNGQTDIRATDAVILAGDISSFGRLSVAGRSVNLSGKVSGGNAIDIAAIDGIDAALSSSILADGLVSLSGRGTIVAEGTIASSGSISFQSDAVLLFGGTLSAGGGIDARANEISTESGAKVIANGDLTFGAQDILRNAGTISAGNVDLRSNAALDNMGSIFGDLKLTIAAGSVSNAGRLTGNGDVAITGQNIALARASDIQVGGGLTLAASENLETNGVLLAIGGAELSGSRQFVQNAAIRLGEGGGRLFSDGLLIQNGAIESNGDLDLFGEGVTGSGALLSAGSIALQAGANGIDYSGNIAAALDLNFRSTSNIRLAGSVVTDGVAHFETGILALDGIVSAGGGIATVNVSALNIGAEGGLISGSDLSLNYIDFTNLGTLASNGRLDIVATGFGINSGTLLAGTELHISTGEAFSNSGTLSSATGLMIDAGGAILHTGLIQSEGPIALAGDALDLRGTLASLGTLGLSSAGDILVSGLVSVDQSANFAARNFEIGATGRVISGDALTISILRKTFLEKIGIMLMAVVLPKK